MQRYRLPRTVPRQQPASRQAQDHKQDHDGQNCSPDLATGHANPAVSSRGATPPRPLSRPRSICRCSAAPPLAPSHPGLEVSVAGTPGSSKGGRVLPRLPGWSSALETTDVSAAPASPGLVLCFRFPPEVSPRYVRLRPRARNCSRRRGSVRSLGGPWAPSGVQLVSSRSSQASRKKTNLTWGSSKYMFKCIYYIPEMLSRVFYI